MIDLWRSYNCVAGIPPGYQHFTVNHSIQFVDFNNQTLHTNTIEGTLAHVKDKIRRYTV